MTTSARGGGPPKWDVDGDRFEQPLLCQICERAVDEPFDRDGEEDVAKAAVLPRDVRRRTGTTSRTTAASTSVLPQATDHSTPFLRIRGVLGRPDELMHEMLDLDPVVGPRRELGHHRPDLVCSGPPSFCDEQRRKERGELLGDPGGINHPLRRRPDSRRTVQQLAREASGSTRRVRRDLGRPARRSFSRRDSGFQRMGTGTSS